LCLDVKNVNEFKK